MKRFDRAQVTSAARAIAEKHGLRFVALFGSHATGRTHAKSDVDIAVLAARALDLSERLALIGEFSDALGREDVEVVDAASASPTLMYALVRDGVPLYEKTEGDFMSWKFYALGVWRDTAWLRDLANRRLHEWADAYTA